MKHISKKEGRSTDTSQDHEYTDWDKVTQFTEQFLTEIGKLEGIRK
jgi:menaquinone-dependent protoporphyrinogen oxidase